MSGFAEEMQRSIADLRMADDDASRKRREDEERRAHELAAASPSGGVRTATIAGTKPELDRASLPGFSGPAAIDAAAEGLTRAAEFGAEGLRGVAHVAATPFTEGFRVAHEAGKALEDSGVVNKEYFPVSQIPVAAEALMASPFAAVEGLKEKAKEAAPGVFDPATRTGRVANALADTASLAVGTVLAHKVMNPAERVTEFRAPKTPLEAAADAQEPTDARRVSFADEMAEAVKPQPRLGPGSPERGAMYLPTDEIAAGYKAAREKVGAASDYISDGLTAHPGLEKVKMPDNPDITADYALSLNRAKAGTEGDIAAVMAREIRQGDPVMGEEFLKVLHYRDLAKRAEKQLAGQLPVKLEGGISAADAMREAVAAEERLRAMPGGELYLHKKLSLADKMRDDMADYAIETGQMSPESVREQYIPHYTEGKFHDQNLPGLVPDSEAAAFVRDAKRNGGELTGRPGKGQHGPTPNAAGSVMQRREKFAEGSTDKLVGDPLDRLAVKYAEIRRRGEMNKFAERLKPLSVTEDVMAGRVDFSPGEHAIYYYGNGKYEIFPREIGEALGKSQTFTEPGELQKALRWSNNQMRKGVLTYNPAFQAKQMLDDPIWGAINAPWGSKTKTLVNSYKNFGKAWRELKLEEQGFPSEMLNEWRRHGTMNEVYETLIDTTSEVKKISDKTKFTGPDGILTRLRKFSDRLGQAREGAVKESLYQTWRERGANPETAAMVANKSTGNFIYKSKLGQELGEVAPMNRWFANAVRILTKDAFKDPVTGERFTKQGVGSSPWTVIAPAAVAALVWNTAATNGENMDIDGLVIPGTKYKVYYPGFGTLVDSIQGIVEHPLEETGKRLAPPLESLGAWLGITKERASIPRDIERFAAPVAHVRRAVDPDRGDESPAVDALRAVLPFQTEDWEREEEYKMRRDRRRRGERR